MRSFSLLIAAVFFGAATAVIFLVAIVSFLMAGRCANIGEACGGPGGTVGLVLMVVGVAVSFVTAWLWGVYKKSHIKG